jgi:hypothetical protein
MTSSRSVHHGQQVCCIQTAVPTEISKVLIRFTLTRLCSYQSIQLSKIVLPIARLPPGRLRMHFSTQHPALMLRVSIADC